ncbi:MAG: hypothetical protein FWH00_01680, partial [Oscillospiraceae bacterium]|nr:hypothetical protein [Oscillospiraceae bacterium]
RYTGGRLTAIPRDTMSFDIDRGILSIMTQSLDTYVLAAQPLLQEVDETNDIIRSGYAPQPNIEPPMEPGTPPPGPPPGDTGNPVTGGNPLFAVNQPANNPNTSDTRVLLPIVMLGVISLCGVLICRRKGGRER